MTMFRTLDWHVNLNSWSGEKSSAIFCFWFRMKLVLQNIAVKERHCSRTFWKTSSDERSAFVFYYHYLLSLLLLFIYLCCCCCYYVYFFIYIFIYLQRHACSVVKYLDREFTKIVNVLWLLAILFYVWNFSFYLIYHLFSYYFIYFFHLLFYLLISEYMSRVYILAASRYYWHVLVCFTIFD